MRKPSTASAPVPFIQKVRDVITQAGGRSDLDTSVYEYVMPVTKAGPMLASVHGPDSGSDVGWVACRFLYPELAVEVIGGDRLNRCSGKWNHHFFSPTTVEQAVEQFRASLARVLVKA